MVLSNGLSEASDPVRKLANLGIELVDLSLKSDDLCRVCCGLCCDIVVERDNVLLILEVCGSQQGLTLSALLVAARRSIDCGPAESSRVVAGIPVVVHGFSIHLGVWREETQKRWWLWQTRKSPEQQSWLARAGSSPVGEQTSVEGFSQEETLGEVCLGCARFRLAEFRIEGIG